MEHQDKSAHEHSDEAIIERCLNGDAEGWKLLMGLVRDMAMKSLQGRGQWRTQDIEDMIQQVNLALVNDDYRILRTYDSKRARLRTYLAGVLTREAMRHARRGGREQLWADPPQSTGRDPTEKAFARLDTWDVIQRGCSPTDALILRLTAWGYRSQEIADILARSLGRPMTEANVRQRRKRAINHLKSQFGDEFSEWLD